MDCFGYFDSLWDLKRDYVFEKVLKMLMLGIGSHNKNSKKHQGGKLKEIRPAYSL